MTGCSSYRYTTGIVSLLLMNPKQTTVPSSCFCVFAFYGRGSLAFPRRFT